MEGIVVIDAALIPQWGIENWFDYLILVKADKERKIKRLLKKGEPLDKIIFKLSVQPLDEEVEKKVDFVIKNNGTIQKLKDKVQKIFKKVIEQE